MALRMIKRGFSGTNEGWTSRGRISSRERERKKRKGNEQGGEKVKVELGSLNKTRCLNLYRGTLISSLLDRIKKNLVTG